ncbi:MAG: acyl-CoA reductase, partial [Hymenobacter sp.]
MNHASRLAAFAALGQRLAALTDDELTDLAARARNRNGWFDLPNVRT